MARRNYGPRGCALSVLLLAAILLVFYGLMRWIESGGPSEAQIKSRASAMIEAAWSDRDVSAIEIDELFAQRERLRWRSSRWEIQGRAQTRPEPNQTVVEVFHASVRVVCDEYDDPACWSLESLTAVPGN